MKCNVGDYERIARLLIGILIVALGVYLVSYWAFISIFFLLTGALRWCPINNLLKINNCKAGETGNPLQK